MTNFHRGDTIRFKGTFYTYAGALQNLSAPPTVTIYDINENSLTSGASTLEGTGIYYYDYEPPDDGTFIFEFSGTLEGKTVIRRKKFTVVFVD